MGAEDCCSTQLIDGNGEFNFKGLENFVSSVKLARCGLSYAVVAIMGPQSSGMPYFFSIAHTFWWTWNKKGMLLVSILRNPIFHFEYGF